MILPNRVSAMLNVICILSIDSTLRLLVLNHRIGIAYDYLDWLAYGYCQTN